jgi:hypothetical protein
MKEIIQARIEAKEVIRVSEKALKKHISLIKKRQHVASVVAMIERLRADVRGDDPGILYEHIAKLNELTRGFAGHALKSSAKKTKNDL